LIKQLILFDKKEIPKKEKRIFFIIILGGFIARILFLVLFIDLSNVNYYEYGTIAENILSGNGYFYPFLENYDGAPYPSAYMPPGYVLLLLPFFLIDEIFLRNAVFLIFQGLLSCIAIYLSFSLTKRFYGFSTAIIAAIISAFLPEFLFASSSLTPTIIYHILILTIFNLLYSLNNNFNKLTLVYLGISFSVLIYFRPEISLFALMYIIYLLIKKQFKATILFISVIVIFVLPWTIRNYMVFSRVIPFTTNAGLNFYRGNNADAIGNWNDSVIISRLDEVKYQKDFEIRMNEIYFNRTFEMIEKNPTIILKNIMLKTFSLWIFNPSEKQVLSPFYLLPWFVILISAGYGIYKNPSWNQFKFIYLFLIFTQLVTMFFLVLPRYQTMMKISLIPFAAFGFISLYNLIKKDQ